MRIRGSLPFVFALALATPVLAAGGIDWSQIAEQSVVEVLTEDFDGTRRKTKVWIVSIDGFGYVRTNDSRWLENIRRGSPVVLRVEGFDHAVNVEESHDTGLDERVEQAFLEKYGMLQRMMSLFRLREPTVLVLKSR